jgi:hypothetical protein
MAGELDDPLLMSGVGERIKEAYGGAGHNGGFGMNPEESSIGIGNMAGEDSSMSLKNLGGGNPHGFEDSELTTNNIVGISAGDKNKKFDGKGGVIGGEKKKKDKKNKDKKKKKKKDKSSSDEEPTKEPIKGTRASGRLNKNQDDDITLINT